MGLTPFTYFEMRCDRCGRPFTDAEGNTVRSDTDEMSIFELMDKVLKSDWARFNNLTLCPECEQQALKEKEQEK